MRNCRSLSGHTTTSRVILALTDVTIYVELDIGVIGPDDGGDAGRQVLPEQPEAQEHDAEIPVLSEDAGQEDKKEHRRSQEASNWVEGIRWVDCGGLTFSLGWSRAGSMDVWVDRKCPYKSALQESRRQRGTPVLILPKSLFPLRTPSLLLCR